MLMDKVMPTLPTRLLGRTDLHVTRLGYGAMEIRGSRTTPALAPSCAAERPGASRASDAVPRTAGSDTVIVGTLQPEHLEQNLRALEAGPLPGDMYAEAKRRLDTAAPIRV